MSELHTATTSPPSAPEQHPEWHEHSDVPTRPLVIFFGIFVVVALLIHVGLWFLHKGYVNTENELDKSRRVSAINVDRKPPEPRLQGVPGIHPETPARDVIKMNQEHDRRMTAYAPATQPGRAQIPVT